MIFNEHLDRLLEVKVVQDFLHKHNMQGKLCDEGGNHSYIIYRLPYVVEFHDALIENYLQIKFSDVNASILACDGDLTWISVSLGCQRREDLRALNFKNHPKNELFISDGEQKMYGLHTNLEAIDKLLPLIESKGGLLSMRDGTFDSRFDFSKSVQPMYPGLKEKYMKCISQAPIE